MKRFLIMLTLFVFVISLGFVEIFYTTKLFTSTHDRLDTIEKSMSENSYNLSNAETTKLIDDAIDFWQKSKSVAMIAANHAVVRSAEEKFVALQSYIHLNERSDAFTALSLAKAFVHELINDNYPILSNIF